MNCLERRGGQAFDEDKSEICAFDLILILCFGKLMYKFAKPGAVGCNGLVLNDADVEEFLVDLIGVFICIGWFDFEFLYVLEDFGATVKVVWIGCDDLADIL